MKTTTDCHQTTHSLARWTGLRPAARSRRDRAIRPLIEPVEARLLLSGNALTMVPFATRLGAASANAPDGGSSPGAFTPAQFQQAYGFNQTQFEDGVTANGSGQTIAIVDAYNDPNITGDLQAFDKQFQLPAPPSFRVVSQNGSSSLPGTDPAGKGTNNWEQEEALDVEWAHAMAPGASILLVEANDSNDSNLDAGVKYAAGQPGVSVVSMSWGRSESSSDTGENSDFTTPKGHIPVTFVASSGDNGTIEYPSSSPNVLGVGGTEVTLNANDTIFSETAWSGSGGGISQYEGLPSYQDNAVPKGTTHRASPDVAYNAGFTVSVFDSYNNGTTTPWAGIFGTSAAAPQWAAIIAIANQGRVLYGLPTLNGATQTLPMLYGASSLDFNDITTGSNKNFSAGPGYDMVTGLGSPNADLVIYSLIGQNFSLVNGALTVNGDQLGANYDDNVALGLTSAGGVEVSLNGMTAQFKPGSVTSVDVFTNGGGNTVTIEATAPNVPVVINMVDGWGTVYISPSGEDLDNIQGDVYLVGGNSSDALSIFDARHSSPVIYSVTSSTVTRTGSASIYYVGVPNLDLFLGSGQDTCEIGSTAQASELLIYGGGGNDTFNISPAAQDLDTIQGNVIIEAGNAGSSTLNVDDTSDSQATTWTMTTTAGWDGSFPTAYDVIFQSNWSYMLEFEAPITGLNSGTDSVVLNGGYGNTTYNIESTAPKIALTVQGGNGNDTFNISPTAQDLMNIQGAVSIQGGGGTNALTFFDNNNTTSVTYLVTSSTVTRSGAAPISYDNQTQGLTLEGGSANDTYNIESTSAYTPVTVTGGAGNDTFNISPTARDLDHLQGNVSVGGGGGTNALNVFDSNNPNAVTYSVTSSTVTRTGAAPISYDSLTQSLTLDGGSANDTYNIESSSSYTPVTVDGGSGKNTFNISPTARDLDTIQGNISVVGGLGTSALNIFDANNPNADTYSVTSSTVTRTGSATISYSSVNSVVLDGGSGNDTFDVNATGGSAAVSVTGGGGNDTLVGPNTTNTWNITGTNAGNVAGVAFTAIPNLTGGTGMDIFKFSAGQGVTGAINGGGGGDWLDYASYTTPVSVNLATGNATGVSGGVTNVQNVRGGSGGNTLTGNALGNILIGSSGTNTLTGGSGRSILIGDQGVATIKGGSDDDIVIGGSTSYDSSSAANDLALEAILAEWQSADSYATRISTIKSGVPGGYQLLWGTTVFDNGKADTLTGGGGMNWFFEGALDKITDYQSGEQIN